MKFVQKENFEPKIKPMIQNLQNELINKKTKKQKVLNFVLTLGRSWRVKKCSETFFRVLECLRKIPNIKKISNEHFNLCEAEISLDEIIKF